MEVIGKMTLNWRQDENDIPYYFMYFIENQMKKYICMVMQNTLAALEICELPEFLGFF